MIKARIFAVVFLFFPCLACISQPSKDVITEAAFDSKENNIGSFIVEQYHLFGKRNLSKLCLQGAAFIQFRVSREGAVVDVKCNGGVHDSLSAFLTNTLKGTTGKWIPSKINGINQDSKIYLLPVLYQLESKCKPVDNSFKNTFLLLKNSGKENQPDKPYFFWSQQFEPLECIVLSPVLLRSSYY